MKYTIKKREPANSFLIDYREALNPAQYEVVTHLKGPILVVAGAGSGKTRTLIYRLARLIESGVSPQNVLLLTFTRKAAQEMLKRAALLMDDRCEKISGGTFHSVACSVLRQYGSLIGLDPAFTILDRSDSEDVLHLLRNTLGLSDKKRRFPRKNTIAGMISSARNKNLTMEEVVLREYDQFSHEIESLNRLQELYALYKLQKQLVDYDDLLVKWLELLKNHPEVRNKLSSLYQYIMVDEYQDTNLLQSDIIRELASPHQNVLVVGDDAQSIYSFRGARFKNMFEFLNCFSGARIQTLEENYRSDQKILDLANQIIEKAKQRHSKHLFTRRGPGRLPVLIQAPDENLQSKFVCQKILELREENVPLHEMAVLFRSSYHSFDLEIELAKYNIPFLKRGGMKFIETAHIKDVLAYLRVVLNPRDAVGWSRILLLMEGIGVKTSQRLIHLFLNAGSFPEGKEKLKQDGSRHLAPLLAMLDSLQGLPPVEQVSRAVDFYYPVLKARYDDYPRRIKDLDHLKILAERFDGLDQFLSELVLNPPEASVAEVEGEREDERMVLTTIHSAKGLEWKVVFVIWVLDGKFPSQYSFNSEEELEEERRLFYVAVTRAKERLFLSYPINIYDHKTGTVFSKPSHFLEDLPAGILEEWHVAPEEEAV